MHLHHPVPLAEIEHMFSNPLALDVQATLQQRVDQIED